MKPQTFIASTFLALFLLSTTAHSEIQMGDLANSIEQQVKSSNAQNAWQLYSPANKLGIEMYFDGKNIQSPSAGAKIVTTKAKYNDSSILGKLEKSRNLNHQVMGPDSGKLNYNDIAYTVQTIQMDCNRKEFAEMEVIADFDNNHTLLNLLPSVRSQPSSIQPNSSYEKLYKLICQ